MNRKLIVTFLIGLVLGAVGVLLAQPFLSRNLPEAVRGKLETVSGRVTAKRVADNGLLLTVVTPEGATLVTFTKRVNEIDLLVESGDSITLSMQQYDPFLRDPEIGRVVKPEPRPGDERSPYEPIERETREQERSGQDTTPTSTGADTLSDVGR